MKGQIAVNVLSLPLFQQAKLELSKDQRDILSKFSSDISDDEFIATHNRAVTVAHAMVPSSELDPLARTLHCESGHLALNFAGFVDSTIR